MSSPTQRSLAFLREQGYTAQVVERWCSHTNRRVDLFGFCDIVAVKPSFRGVLFVQTTSGSCVSARLKKMRDIATVGIVLAAGNAVIVHGWRKIREKRQTKAGKPSKRKVWDCREINFEPIANP